MSFSLFKKTKEEILGKPLTFWFIRHAESEGNAEGRYCPVEHDTLLTDKGKKDAEKAANYFKSKGVVVTDVYSPPLKRSEETAKIIANAFDLPVKLKDGLHERRWGEYKDLVWDELSKKLDTMSMEERYESTPADGESWKDMEERLFATLDEIAKENDRGENVVIITHRGCLRAILPLLAGSDKAEHKTYSVDTASITKFSFDKGGFEFVGLIPD